MCGSNEPGRMLRILNLRKGHLEIHRKRKPALYGGKEAHPTVDRDVAHLDPLATTHRAKSALEASRKTYGEELLRVRAAALSAHLLR